MKFLLYLLLFSFSFKSATAQEKYFIFIQSENKLPFYVNLNGKIYSSTATGYLIIPKLTDGSYNFIVGFAQDAYPEQKFQSVIDKKDVGYALKNFGEKGWGLFNLQNYVVTMATKPGATETAIAKTEVKPEISFDKPKENPKPVVQSNETKPVVPETKIEQNAVKPAKEEPVIKEKEAIINPQIPEEKKQQPIPEKKEVETPTSNEVEKNKPVVKKSKGITKIAEKKTEEGVYLSFLDGQLNKPDTVELIVPNSKNQAILSSVNSSTPPVEEVKVQKSVSDPIRSEANNLPEKPKATTKNEKVKFLDMEADRKKKVDTLENAKTSKPPLQPNSGCSELASEDDYAKLRKKMAGHSGDEKMIAEARKQFRNKCYSTDQVRQLSTLFLSDEGRYKFFDEMYVLVSDPAAYPVLEKEFIDPYYSNRFKAILRN